MTKNFYFFIPVPRRNCGLKNANFAREEDRMKSVGSNFLCGRPHDAYPPPPVRRRPSEPDPSPSCGRIKWMAPNRLTSQSPIKYRVLPFGTKLPAKFVQ